MSNHHTVFKTTHIGCTRTGLFFLVAGEKNATGKVRYEPRDPEYGGDQGFESGRVNGSCGVIAPSDLKGYE